MIARQAATLLLSIALLTPAPVRAQQERITFRHLTIADGLSQNAVRSIVQDPRGFLWSGTKEQREVFDEFGSICSLHQVNLWTVLVSKP